MMSLGLLVVISSNTAVAETQRGNDFIERALKLQPDLNQGEALYREHCATCHGPEAYGNPATVIPSLAGQLPIYVIKQLADIAESERVAPEMHRIVAMKPMSTPQASGGRQARPSAISNCRSWSAP
jgi:cytochrome c553